MIKINKQYGYYMHLSNCKARAFFDGKPACVHKPSLEGVCIGASTAADTVSKMKQRQQINDAVFSFHS